jgi:uncharacterized protein (TIGR03118 family)
VAAVLAAAAGATLALTSAAGATGGYRQFNIVSDQAGHAAIHDPSLVNAWGLAAGPGTPIWVANNGTSTATLYNGDVGGSAPGKVPLTVNTAALDPTGQVYNPTLMFKVPVGSAMIRSRFIFDSESGQISAWPLTPHVKTSATVMASVKGAVFKGIALAWDPGHGPMLYAADFEHGIDVFNGSWHQVHLDGSFTDPTLPAGWGPFNVQNIDGKLYVAFAKRGAAPPDEQDGAHLGRVDVFDTDGHFLRHLAIGGPLNAPWGLVKAPSGFGQFSGDILVGNFGDGLIHAYNPANGMLEGNLKWPNGSNIQIDGLWGLRFGNSAFAGTKGLVFSSGPDGEAHGLLGIIRAAS